MKIASLILALVLVSSLSGCALWRGDAIADTKDHFPDKNDTPETIYERKRQAYYDCLFDSSRCW